MSQNDSQLDIQVTDQQEQQAGSSTKESNCREEASINDHPEIKHKTTENSELSSNANMTEIKETAEFSGAKSTKESPTEARVGTNIDTLSIAGDDNGSSCVEVEDDGSMFVQANSDYIESKKKGRVEFGNKATTGGEIQFSNKLVFSLD